MRPLGLHQMSALELSPVELVPLAREVGCEQICVFVHLPIRVMPVQEVTPAMVPEMLARMSATGVSMRNIEFFLLAQDTDVESYRPAVELGAELGGERLVTIIYDTVQARAAENLARMCDLAAEYGMQVGLEFTGLTSGCSSLESAANFIRQVAKPNAGFDVDCLHLVRTGGKPEDVAALPAELFGYSQICDGADLELRSDYMTETFERMVPGEGVFPVAEIMAAVPAATPIDVEVPSLEAPKQGVPTRERVQRAVAAARAILDRVQHAR